MTPVGSSNVQTVPMPTLPDEIKARIANWPAPARNRLTDLRAIILAVASRADVGDVLESLKWGQPSWRPARPRVGSTLRCDWHETAPNRLSLYVHCQTTLVETMRDLHPHAFDYDGRRALHMMLDTPMPGDAVDHCAFLTLTYHRKAA